MMLACCHHRHVWITQMKILSQQVGMLLVQSQGDSKRLRQQLHGPAAAELLC
jgi:hypothetical protein